MQVQSPAWEEPLEEGMAAHPNILAWRIPRTDQKVPSDPFLRSPTPPKKKPLLISFSRRLVWPFWNFIHTNEIIQLDFLGGLLSLHIVDPAFFGKESVLYKVRFFLNQQETRPQI